MAVGSFPREHSWSAAAALPEAPPAAGERRGSRPSAPTEGGLDLELVSAAIQDGLLMVFGPDGDPVPPQVFGVAAAEQPHAGVRLAGGPPVPAERIAAALEAQINGRFAPGHGDGEAWIRAMLGGGPAPEMAGSDDLLAEGCSVDVVAFGKELMLTCPDGATFLVAAARSRTPISLRRTGEGPIALGDLVAHLLARADAGHSSPHAQEFTAPACRAWLEGDALRIDLPEFGAVELARSDDAAIAAPSVCLFLAGGEVAALDDLLSALSGRVAPPSASERADPRHQRLPRCAPDRLPPAAPLDIALPDALAAEPDRVALVVLHGLRDGARPSAGVASGDGSWLLSPRDLPGLSIALPPEGVADLALEVAAIAVANAEGELTSAATTVSLPLRSAAPEPAPRLGAAPWHPAEPAPSSSVEATAEPAPCAPVQPAQASIPLNLDPQVLGEGGPFDAVIVRDLPSGVTLSAGTYDPAIAGWVLRPDELSELNVIAACGARAQFTVCLRGICLESGGGPRARVLARVPVSSG